MCNLNPVPPKKPRATREGNAEIIQQVFIII